MHGTSFDASDLPEAWELIATLSFAMPASSTATVRELEACTWGVAFFANFMEGPDASKKSLSACKPIDTSKHQVSRLAQLLQ